MKPDAIYLCTAISLQLVFFVSWYVHCRRVWEKTRPLRRNHEWVKHRRKVMSDLRNG